jgi:hypothetical protein
MVPLPIRRSGYLLHARPILPFVAKTCRAASIDGIGRERSLRAFVRLLRPGLSRCPFG